MFAGPDVWELHPIFDDSDRKHLKRTCNDIVRETTLAREWHGFPREAAAIGGNGAGDLLILLPDPSSGEFGDAVFWWNHETAEINQVANNFWELEDEEEDNEDDG